MNISILKTFLMKAALFLYFSMVSLTVEATTYYVSPSGSDNNDGLSTSNPFKTIAYACSKVPTGNHTIQLATGTYYESQTIYLKTGHQLIGAGSSGSNASIVTNTVGFTTMGSPCDYSYSNYLVGVSDKDNFSIKNIGFESSTDNLLDGAILLKYSENFTIENVNINTFRWAGIYMRECGYFELHHSTFTNANNERHCNTWSGNVHTRYIWHSTIHHCKFVTSVNNGYGYKGSGHEKVRFHDNTIDSKGEFAFESAHEHEYGLEIDHNTMNRCISVPKPDGGANPADRDCDYAVSIHHNNLSDSYTVEGPRNYLIIRDNFINIAHTGGRVYSHHGGTSTEIIKIHNNVILNVDRSFVWANSGTSRNIKMFNNTIYCADAGSRTGSVIDFPGSNNLNMSGWEFRNNVVIAPASKPRTFMWNRDNTSKVSVSNNLFVNVNSVPSGNSTGIDPGFVLSGNKPFPYYLPANSTSPVVDAGIDVGFSYKGAAPDIGAYEYTPNVISSAGWYTLQNKANSNLLDTDGDEVDANHSTVRDDTKWKIVSQGEGYYTLENKENGKLLDTDGDEVDANHSIVRDDTKWKIVSRGEGYYTLENRENGKLLDTDGDQVDANHSTVRDDTKWKLTQVFSFAKVAAANHQMSEGDFSDIKIYPNPLTSELLTIELPKSGSGQIEIYDLTGKLIYKQLFSTQNKITISKNVFGRGIFILGVHTDSSNSYHRVVIP